MRRLLYVLLLLALLVPAGSVFAEPQVVEQIPDGMWVLGEIWWTPDDLFGAPIWDPGERVDAWLTRPATLEWDDELDMWVKVWPFEWGPWNFWEGWDVPWADVEPWFLGGLASQQRRVSYAEDWLYATQWGGYYAEFLLPRDEVWFPCSWPLKWKCDYELAPDVWERHSPQIVIVEPSDPSNVWDPEGITFLNWAPFDTVSPLVIDIFNDAVVPTGVQYQLEIIGYTYYASDIP